jgi:NtrC-family two-component system sensor histidine kinase KinB
LLLGCLLLVALVTALSMLVRTSFVELRKLDVAQQDADRAAGAMASAQGSLAREQIVTERAALAYAERMAAAAKTAPAANGGTATHQQADDRAKLDDRIARTRIEQFATITQQRLKLAADAVGAFPGAPNIDDEVSRHESFRLRFHRTNDYTAAGELEPLNGSLSRRLETVRDLRDRTEGAVENDRQTLRARLIAVCGFSILVAIGISVATIVMVILPLRQTAATAKRIGQGELHKRIEWSVNDDLGEIATEVNRMAIRLRDLRETEAGRRQMEHQLSDAVVQSIFEPVIVTDARGQLLKLNQAAREMLGEAAADRMALTNTPGGDKILSAIAGAVSMQRAMAAEGEAAMLPMRVGQAQRGYRLRTTPMRDSEGRLQEPLPLGRLAEAA